MIQLTIYGQLWSMKNHRIPLKQNPYKTIPDKKAREFMKTFLTQVALDVPKTVLTGPLRAVVTVYYPSERQDLDAELIFDLLQKAGFVKNDRQFIEKHLYRATDRNNPRVEINIEPIGDLSNGKQVREMLNALPFREV